MLLMISCCCFISLFIVETLKYSFTIGDEKYKSTIDPRIIIDNTIIDEINAGQARAILQRKTTQGMLQLWKKLLTEKISVRKTEKLASKRKVSPQLQNIQDKLSRLIGEKVVINQNAKTKKGFVKINFSKQTVSRVLDKLQSIKSD